MESMKNNGNEVYVGNNGRVHSIDQHWQPDDQDDALMYADALTELGPWLEYADQVLQRMLTWQQAHSEDRFNLEGLLKPSDEVFTEEYSPQGMPYWIQQDQQTPWLDGLAPPQACGRLADVVMQFDLTVFDTQVLMLTALPLFDSRYQLIISYLQGDSAAFHPGIGLALTMFSPTPVKRVANRLALCSRTSRLIHHGLVYLTERNGNASTQNDVSYLRLSEAVFHFLCGEPASTLKVGSDDVVQWASPAADTRLSNGLWSPVADQISRLFLGSSFDSAPTQLLLLLGGAGRQTLVTQLGQDAGYPVLVLDLGQLPSEVSDAKTLLRDALRALKLYKGCLLIKEWTAGAERHPGLMRTLESMLARHGLPVVCLVTADEAGNVLPGLSRLRMTLPPRAAEDDARLMSMCAQTGVDAWDWGTLMKQVRPDPDALKQTWQEAQGYRLLRAPAALLEVHDLQQALQLRGQQNFRGLAQRKRPQRTFDDLIVSEGLMEHLHEILAAVRQRAAVLSRGFAQKVGYGTGISALFYGSSGTGKTMAAEVLAGALGLDLIRVDLSTVVNKYIGETEKNLASIFDMATADTGVLLFDEADALFGKRSEVKNAQDRHANIEVSYLLQRLEQYPGLVVLTTNNRAHLDEAFTRRLTFMSHFEAPDAGLRARMWQEIWPAKVSVEDDVDWTQWAGVPNLTGAGIRNAALLASWLAAEEGRPVSHTDILRAVTRELDKTGRFMPSVPRLTGQ